MVKYMVVYRNNLFEKNTPQGSLGECKKQNLKVNSMLQKNVIPTMRSAWSVSNLGKDMHPVYSYVDTLTTSLENLSMQITYVSVLVTTYTYHWVLLKSEGSISSTVSLDCSGYDSST